MTKKRVSGGFFKKFFNFLNPTATAPTTDQKTDQKTDIKKETETQPNPDPKIVGGKRRKSRHSRRSKGRTRRR